MIGEPYAAALAGRGTAEIESADGRRRPLRVADWLRARPGDAGLLLRCSGATLDVGSGPGRLTVALAELGLPSLGIDVTPYAVEMTRAAGGLALHRDVFDRVPGTGRWRTVLLADGNVGIGGDPGALLHRVAQLLAPDGRALVEVEPRGGRSRVERVRLVAAERRTPWFDWAHLALDDAPALAARCGMRLTDHWEEAGRCFAVLAHRTAARPAG
ncbi:SAM-dependent methyltransferase [Actinomadura craniellae]|uniref:SAM-dependent methyltransferase n=1 Tax=Actinomadura craniellae TaxID=2231787 RepID=A0A365HAR0_9ACTN|nr:methyltransferase domain-containing protein [Actinomadura craniellae]RAY16102.1 SAM-dependent methyltransferase [Actinomadura craniellae]